MIAKKCRGPFIPFGNPGLFDEFLQSLAVAVFETPLLRVGKLSDWSLFEPAVMRCVAQEARGPGGRPRFHPPAPVGGRPVPDGQTLADFREALVEQPVFERLFQLLLEPLQQRHGLGLGRAGVMIDATFVEVPRQRNRREPNALLKQGVVPQEFTAKPAGGAHQDCAARWTKKNHEPYYGYKDQVKGDVADKLILAGVTTAASVHDRQQLEGLV